MARAISPMRMAQWLFLLCSAALAACSTSSQLPHSAKGPLVWPQHPDKPRFAFETVLRAPADISGPEVDSDRLMRQLTGVDTTPNAPAFEKPGAIAAHSGSIFIADTRTKMIVVFDVPRRKVYRFGVRAPGTLAQPSGIALDAAMNVYVADAGRRQVVVYDKLGLYQRALGGPADLERPTGVAVSPDGERIYAVDRSTNESDRHRVVIYDKDGAKIGEIGTRGASDGQFNVPLQAAVAPDGTLYVLDSGNFRIQAFDRDGNFLRAFGKPGINPGNLARPRGLAVDNEGNVYVSDASFNNFQVFDAQGQLLLAVGAASTTNGPGRYGLLNGIAVDETGRVYVVDQLYNKVEVIRRVSDDEAERILQLAAR